MQYGSSIMSDDFILDKSNVPKLNISTESIYLKKKKLIEISKNLSKIEYFEIFNIIQDDKCPYSENKNGIFINLSNMTENTIDKIYDFINFIKHKKEDLLKHEELINDTKKNLTIPINKNITENIINQNNQQYKDDIIENIEELDSESDDNEYENYLEFSSDEDNDLENKLSLKKKKNKYSGNKAKMIKSIKSTGDVKKDLNKI